MPTNPIVERLRVDRRSLDIYAVPPLPKITPIEAKRAPELAAYVERLETAWAHLGATIKDRLLALTDFQDKSAQNSLTSADLAKLQAVFGGHVVGNNADISGLQGQIVIINEAVDIINNQITHIENLITHIFQQLGSNAQLFLFPADAPSWTATHSFGRRVTVELFDESWDRFEAFVEQPDAATVITRLVPDGRGAILIS